MIHNPYLPWWRRSWSSLHEQPTRAYTKRGLICMIERRNKIDRARMEQR